MKILTFNWHTPYLSLLARLNHEFEVAPPNLEGAPMGSWDETMRPIPSNVKLVSAAVAKERLAAPGYYGLMLAHNVKDIVMAQPFNLPKILVFHNRLSTEAQLGGKLDIAPAYRESVRQLVSNIYCVFISASKRNDWGLAGDIILPGVDTSLYGGYTGEIRRALRVGNNMKLRDLMTGYTLAEETMAGLPGVVMGMNPDIPGASVSKGWEELKAAYRANRALLNTTTPRWEDGYNLVMLEAMATGMPVVSLANPTSPITDGVDGFTGHDAGQLRTKVMKLLDGPELARAMGAEGRRTVERLFPIGAFLEKWETAIARAVECHPGSPKYVEDIIVAGRDKAVFKRPNPEGKNIILSYTSYPVTAASYLHRALGAKHNILTVGARLTPDIIRAWDLHGLKEEAGIHDIHTPDLTVDAEFMLERLPDDMNPDFFLWVETGLGKSPAGLGKLHIPKAAYFIDTHLHMARHIEAAKDFDAVFLAQRAYIPEFKKRGIANVFWLPLACDPDIHGMRGMDKKYDVGFVGSMGDPRRVALLQTLAEKVDVRYERFFMREMADFFCSCRIVFNNAIKNDLNMRVFEAMCSGSLLLTDHADGLTDFFRNGEHLVIYNDGNIAGKALHYLSHPRELQQIAEAGRRAALARHTYAHRVDEIVRVMENLNS